MRRSIVYVSISGFGEKGPYAKKPTYDPIIQALSGLTSVQGGSDTARPRLIRTVLPDKLTAVTAAQAISAALVARFKSGVGQHVRLSMLDAVLAFLWASDMSLQTFVGQEVTGRTAASFIDLIYETSNGFMTVAVMGNKEWTALTRALERPEWLDDARFKTPALRDQNIDDRLQMTQDVLKSRTTEEWLERLEAEGVPCAPVLTRDQVIAHPQVLASNILHGNRASRRRPPAPDAAGGAVCQDAAAIPPRRAAAGRAYGRGPGRAGAVPPGHRCLAKARRHRRREDCGVSDERLHAPAVARNREPILAVLRSHLPPRGLVLEIASGSGEHIVHFAQAFPSLDFQPSDPDRQARASIDAWRAEAGLQNVRPAIALDAAAETWPISAADAVLCINMIHIAPWEAAAGLVRGAAALLRADGMLYLYGPFRRDGAHTAPSNAAFDRSLRQQNPDWGVRDLEAVTALAQSHGFADPIVEAMPANNLSLVFKKRV